MRIQLSHIKSVVLMFCSKRMLCHQMITEQTLIFMQCFLVKSVKKRVIVFLTSSFKSVRKMFFSFFLMYGNLINFPCWKRANI